MLNGGKAVRDRDGKIIKAAAFQAGEKEAKPGRVAPDRRWFGEWWRCAGLRRGGLYGGLRGSVHRREGTKQLCSDF